MEVKILTPHKEQESWVYFRTRAVHGHDPRPCWERSIGFCLTDGEYVEYMDEEADHRIISSRRVEMAVETADYLKRCEAEGLGALYAGGCWTVGQWMVLATFPPVSRGFFVHGFGIGSSLRMAYYSYKNNHEGSA